MIKNHIDRMDFNKDKIDTLEVIINKSNNINKMIETMMVVDINVKRVKIETINKIRSNILFLGSSL